MSHDYSIKDVIVIAFMLGLWLYSIILMFRYVCYTNVLHFLNIAYKAFNFLPIVGLLANNYLGTDVTDPINYVSYFYLLLSTFKVQIINTFVVLSMEKCFATYIQMYNMVIFKFSIY